MFEIDEEVIHDELGEVTINDEPYMHIGDIEVVEIFVTNIPDDFKPYYGSGLGIVDGGYIFDVAIDELRSK